MNFDFIAPYYAKLEYLAFGETLEKCRFKYLPDLNSPRQVLIIGEGDGRFLAALLNRYPEASVDCLDASPKMLELAQRRLKLLPAALQARVNFITKRVEDYVFENEKYDLLVTHFFLDCLDKVGLQKLMPILAKASASDCLWLYADFHIPARSWKRLYAQLCIKGLYAFFGLTAKLPVRKLVDAQPYLENVGYTLKSQTFYYQGLLQSSLWFKRIKAG